MSEWDDANICIHCDLPKRLHMGRRHHCVRREATYGEKGQATYESKTDVRLVRHVDRGILGQEEPQLIPLPITDDRNENPDYAAWRDEFAPVEHSIVGGGDYCFTHKWSVLAMGKLCPSCELDSSGGRK